MPIKNTSKKKVSRRQGAGGAGVEPEALGRYCGPSFRVSTRARRFHCVVFLRGAEVRVKTDVTTQLLARERVLSGDEVRR